MVEQNNSSQKKNGFVSHEGMNLKFGTHYQVVTTLLKKGARVPPLGVLVVMFIFDTPRVL